MNNIKELRKRLGLSQIDFADKIGVTSTTIQNWEYGKTEPNTLAINTMVKEFGVSADWLLGGEENAVTEATQAEERRNTVPVPYFDNVRVSAGYGIEVFSEEPDGIYEMPEKFFNGIGNKRLNCIRVSGDSMAPRFDDGDWIFIIPTQAIRSEGIFVVRVRGALLVKKVQWLPNGLKLLSENKDYEPVLLNEDTCPPDEVSIVGKVVLIVSRP